jgi:choline-sulfatase
MEYYAAVSAIDWNVGRLLEVLKANGTEHNTLVIFSADHGDTFGKRPGTSLPSPKTVCYDDSAKVPLMMRWPAGLPRALTYRGGVSSVDIMPTILEAAGVPIPSRVQGRSRIREIQTNDLGWKEPVFMENITHTPIADGKIAVERAVRTERWKLILRDHPRHELYDMQADPGEANDLFARPEYAATIRELAGLIQDWGRRLGDRVAVELAGKV